MMFNFLFVCSAYFWHCVNLPLQCNKNKGGVIMNKNLNNIVNYGDRICASLECNGRRLASVNGVNFTSLEAVKNALLELAGRYVGMAVLTVRNCTQGWRDVTALATMRRPVNATQQALGYQPRIGNQYVIPWAS
jgi:hypothetical protein